MKLTFEQRQLANDLTESMDAESLAYNLVGLQAENRALREALTELHNFTARIEPCEYLHDTLIKARAALGKQGE